MLIKGMQQKNIIHQFSVTRWHGGTVARQDSKAFMVTRLSLSPVTSN